MILEAPKGIETSTDEELSLLKQEVIHDKEKKELKFYQEGYNAAKNALENGRDLAKQMAEKKLNFPDSKAKVEKWAEETVKTLPYIYLLKKNAEIHENLNKLKNKRGERSFVEKSEVLAKLFEVGGDYIHGDYDQMRALWGSEEAWEFGSRNDTLRGILNNTAYKTKEGVDREDPKKLEEIFNSRPEVFSPTAFLDTGHDISEGEYMYELGKFMVLVEKLNEYGN